MGINGWIRFCEGLAAGRKRERIQAAVVAVIFGVALLAATLFGDG